MKYSFVILAVLLSCVFTQELIVDSYTGSYTTGTVISQTYQRPEWNNFLDFAIYGWFKISSAYSRTDWSTGFHFTSNTDQSWTDYKANGDRVLAFQHFSDQLHNPTYSLAQKNTNYYSNLSIKSADLDKWAFTYVSIGSVQQAQFAYYKLGSSGEISKKLSPVTHVTSNFYQIKVGQSFSYKYFPGTIWRLTLIAGPTAYRESGFEVVQNIKPDQTPPSCPIVFTGCAQTGTATNMCESVPKYDVTTISSIYLPSGYLMTIYDTNNFAGKKVTYNKSIECITSFNWAMLVNTGAITVVDDDRVSSLRRVSKQTNKK